MSAQQKDVVVIIGPGSIGAAVARRVGVGRTLLLAAHDDGAGDAAAQRLEDDGYEVVVHTTDIAEKAQVEALAARAAELGRVTHLVQAAGVSPTQASVERIMQVDLVGTAHVLDAFASVIAPGGAGIVVASMAGHRESPYPREIEDALVNTPTDELISLPFLQESEVGSSVHAYALAKRGNALRVLASAAVWGRRGARINSISPGVIITPLARDELSGPRADWFEQVRATCAAGRFSTSEEVATVSAFLLGPDAAFITGADLLMDGGVTAAIKTGDLQV